MLRIAKLKRYPENHRTCCPEPNAPNNAEIGELGCMTPIFIDADNGVGGGHGRLQAAEQCAMVEVPAIRLAYLSPEEAQACGIADDRRTEPGGCAHRLPNAEPEALRAVDLDLEFKGFDYKALADLMPMQDARPRLTTGANSTNGRAGPRDVRLTDMQTAREPARDGEPACVGGFAGGGRDWLDGGAERPGKKGATHASPIQPLGPPVKGKGTRGMTALGFPLCCRDDLSSWQFVNVLTRRYGDGSKGFMLRCFERARSDFAVVALKANPPHGANREHGLHAAMPEKVGATHASPDARPGRPLPTPSTSHGGSSTVQICIFIRGGFPLRKRPSKGWREPFFEPLAKTRNVGKAAPAAIQRDTARLARPAPPLARTPASDCFRLASPREHCENLYLYP